MTEVSRPIIQGGMGIGVSDWRLARAVAEAGQLGVVSGTGIGTVMARRLQDGDEGGHIRRALESFPDPQIARKILEDFFLPEGRPEGRGYRLNPMPNLASAMSILRLTVVGSFVEVFLAKEGGLGPIGINLMEKVQFSNLPGLYGAMLAGVDVVLMGAGIPREIPGALDAFSENKEVSIKAAVIGEVKGTAPQMRFDPNLVFPDLPKRMLRRPAFFAIVASATLAAHLARKSTGRVDGFVIEGPTAGGHNAPPRGPLRLGVTGEPIYSERDSVDYAALRALEIPFWLAGGYGSAEKLQEARALGAQGIQVGTAFAFCEESGLTARLRNAVIAQWARKPEGNGASIFTDPLASPTDFPFKVLPLEGTLSQPEVYGLRERRCDLGYLRQVVAAPDGGVIYRCPAEPVADYVRKGGKVEDTAGRKCLCNALMANIGLGQQREDSFLEPALLTAGDDLRALARFVPEGRDSYRASDVIAMILGASCGNTSMKC
ncbi:MAG: nitronate monooxygenase [Bdellovibrionales bacterium]|nr:nitronate monooxygenase [Bdellovibrionales bacterium]